MNKDYKPRFDKKESSNKIQLVKVIKQNLISRNHKMKLDEEK